MSKMPISYLKLIMRCAEFLPKDQIYRIPKDARGMYVLYTHNGKKQKCKYDVVYIGMGCRQRILDRLRIHKRHKKGLWTHFSAFEVWPNITNEEIAEVEGLFRHIYREDTRVNRLNLKRGFNKLNSIIRDTRRERWLKPNNPLKKRK